MISLCSLSKHFLGVDLGAALGAGNQANRRRPVRPSSASRKRGNCVPLRKGPGLKFLYKTQRQGGFAAGPYFDKQKSTLMQPAFYHTGQSNLPRDYNIRRYSRTFIGKSTALLKTEVLNNIGFCLGGTRPQPPKSALSVIPFLGTRTRTNTNPYDTKASASGWSGGVSIRATGVLFPAYPVENIT